MGKLNAFEQACSDAKSIAVNGNIKDSSLADAIIRAVRAKPELNINAALLKCGSQLAMLTPVERGESDPLEKTGLAGLYNARSWRDLRRWAKNQSHLKIDPRLVGYGQIPQIIAKAILEARDQLYLEGEFPSPNQ